MAIAFDSINQDLQFALRSFAKYPGFTIATILILSLGIGPNIAIFSVVRAVLLQASPFPDPDQLVVMWEADLERERPPIEVSHANFLDWQTQSRMFEDMAAFGSVNWGQVLTGTGDPDRSPDLHSRHDPCCYGVCGSELPPGASGRRHRAYGSTPL